MGFILVPRTQVGTLGKGLLYRWTNSMTLGVAGDVLIITGAVGQYVKISYLIITSSAAQTCMLRSATTHSLMACLDFVAGETKILYPPQPFLCPDAGEDVELNISGAGTITHFLYYTLEDFP